MKTLPLCNLCKQNLADHPGSHIFPRFLGVTLLTTQDNKRKSYLLEKDPHNEQRPNQDTPKIPNILCCSCESKIGEFERKFANEFYYPFKNLDFQKNSELVTKPKGFKAFINNKIDYQNFKFVIYSMLFRAIISGHKAFSDLRVSDNQKETLRQVLNKEIEFIDIPIYVLTSENDTKYRENYIFANSIIENAPMLWANELIFFVDFHSGEEIFKKFESFKMESDNNTKVRILSNQEWDTLRQFVMKKRIEKILEN